MILAYWLVKLNVYEYIILEILHWNRYLVILHLDELVQYHEAPSMPPLLALWDLANTWMPQQYPLDYVVNFWYWLHFSFEQSQTNILLHPTLLFEMRFIQKCWKSFALFNCTFQSIQSFQYFWKARKRIIYMQVFPLQVNLNYTRTL